MSLITELRKPKVFDMAIFDWVATAVAAYWLAGSYNHDFWIVFVLLVLIGVIVHWLLNTPTMFNAYLGLNTKEAVYAERLTA